MLNAYLIKPVQRITKYPLLLKVIVCVAVCFVFVGLLAIPASLLLFLWLTAEATSEVHGGDTSRL